MDGIIMQTAYPIRPESLSTTRFQVEPFDHRISFGRDGADSELLETVERGLCALGENTAQIIFYNLYRRYSLSKPEILRKPERFIKALSDLFGAGADTIEKLVVEAICARFGLHPNLRSEFGLPECLTEVKCIRRATEGKAEKAAEP